MEQARRYGVLLYYTKRVTDIPTKYFITEEVPIRDNQTFKSLLLRRKSIDKINVQKVGEKTFIASVEREGMTYESTPCESIRQAEEEVARDVIATVSGPEAPIQLFRRQLSQGTVELKTITYDPFISSRYNLGFAAEVPKSDWESVAVTILPINEEGVAQNDECGAHVHIATHSIKVKFGKSNVYTPVKYTSGLTGVISFNGCMGPKCSRHTPQVYALNVLSENFRWTKLFSVSHHLERRGAADNARVHYNNILEQVQKQELCYLAGVPGPKPKQGPELTIMHKHRDKLKKVSVRNSSSSEDEQAYDVLRSSEDDDRRRPRAPWEIVQTRMVIPSMNSPAKIELEPVNIDEFMNYLSLYCAKAYAVHNGNQGITVGYLSVVDAMCDYAQMGAGHFPVRDVKMITSAELLQMAKAGSLIAHNHDQAPIVKGVIETVVPIKEEKMCTCKGDCTELCVRREKYL